MRDLDDFYHAATPARPAHLNIDPQLRQAGHPEMLL